MKLYVTRNQSAYGCFVFNDMTWPSDFLIGTVDLPIEKPKKTVVKEASAFYSSTVNDEHTYKVHVPVGAKNIKCTYEITEETA